VKYIENKTFEKKIFHIKIVEFQQIHQTAIPFDLERKYERILKLKKF